MGLSPGIVGGVLGRRGETDLDFRPSRRDDVAGASIPTVPSCMYSPLRELRCFLCSRTWTIGAESLACDLSAVETGLMYIGIGGTISSLVDRDLTAFNTNLIFS